MRKIILIYALSFFGICNAQIDSTYYYEAKKILVSFPKSKISAEDLYNSAVEVYAKDSIVVPYELAIAQAITESSLGNAGVGKHRNNPFSINSKKGYLYFKTMADGVLAYYYFVSKKYLRCKSLSQLLNRFTNCQNKRYASDRLYEVKLKKRIKQLLLKLKN